MQRGACSRRFLSVRSFYLAGGAISELRFYASVVRDAIRGDFQFEDQSIPKNCAVSRGDILHTKRYLIDEKTRNNFGGRILSPMLRQVDLEKIRSLQ